MTIEEAINNLDNLLIACDESGREAWQTLKNFVFSQQTNNKASAPCQHYFYINKNTTVVRCIHCGAMFPFKAQHQNTAIHNN